MPIIIKSAFTPMTYDEITKPLLELTAAQQAMEETYLEANDKASRLMALANQLTDPIAYNKLKTYAEDLKILADNLIAKGLQTGSRLALFNMRKRYLNEINPIELAATRRRELSDELRKLLILNPDLLFERNMRDISLDDMINNSELTYGNVYSGTMLTKRMNDIANAIAKGKVSIETMGNIDPLYKAYMKKIGIDTSILEEAINNGINTLDAVALTLAKAKLDILTSSGISSWGDLETLNKADAYLNEGIRNAFRQADISMQSDLAYKEALDYAYFKKKADYQASFKNPTNEQSQYNLTPTNIYSLEEVDDNEEVRKYFIKQEDGTYKLSKKGLLAYKDIYRSDMTVGAKRSKLYKLITSLNGGKPIEADNDKVLTYKINQIYNLKNPELYDATRLTEYNFDISSGDIAEWTNKIGRAANGKLYEAKWDTKSKSWILGESVDTKDLKGSVTSISFSPYGFTMRIGSGVNSKRYMLPIENINSDVANNLKVYSQILSTLQSKFNESAKNNGIVELTNEDKVILKRANIEGINSLTSADIAYLMDRMEQNCINELSTLGKASKVKSQEFE